MNWRVKGLVQKVLSGVPGGVRVNDALQRTTGELRNLDSAIDSKVVDDWVVLARQLRELQVPVADAVLVEVGTGWFPVLPLCFAVAGVRVCHTFDVTPHLSGQMTVRAISQLRVHLPRIAEAAGVSAEAVEERYEHVRAAPSVAAALERAGVRYHAPGDAARTGLDHRSVDVVFSNSVLEHVPASEIASILRESARILKPAGVSLHSVNCGDHYAYFDKSITLINYLKYSDRQWSLWNNALLYQNRLRPVDFLRLAEEAGLEIVLSRFTPKARLLDMLPTLGVAEQFKTYPPDQLCSTSVDFAGRPANGTGASNRASISVEAHA